MIGLNKRMINTLSIFSTFFLVSTIMQKQEMTFATPAKNSTEDKIHFIDTEKGGDAILIESNGRFALLDSGERSETNVKIVKEYLKSVGATHLDYFIASHMHSDHIGNISPLIDSGVKVENVISIKIPGITSKTTDRDLSDNNNPLKGKVADIEFKDATLHGKFESDWKSDIYFRDMLKSFEKRIGKNVTEVSLNKFNTIGGEGYHIYPTENSTLKFGDYTIKFNNVFGGSLDDYNNKNNIKVTALEDTNATSMFVTVTDNKNNKIYFSGDGRAENIEKLFAENPGMYKNVSGYKMSHHGANDSKYFIDTIVSNNPNIKMFAMSPNPGYVATDYVLGKGVQLYVTNPYRNIHNGSFSVNLTNSGLVVNKAKATEYKWVYKNNEWYLYENNILIKNSWKRVDNQYYYLDSSGKALKDGWKKINNMWYYFAGKNQVDYFGKKYPECAMLYDTWITDGVDWYYVGEYGDMLTNQWVSETTNGKKEWYYVGEDGRMLRGEHKIGNETFYFAPTSGHTSYSSKTYKDGQMYDEEWLSLGNGKWKYFKKDGYMAKNETLTIDGVKYTFNSEGTY